MATMTSISHTVGIREHADRVFDFVTNPENWTKYVTSLVDVRDVSTPAPGKGTTFTWEYKMLGMRFTGQGEITEFERNSRFAMKLSGKFPITETYEFREETGGTALTVRIDYELPGSVIGKLMDNALIDKLNDMEARNVLEKIRVMLEGTASTE